MLGPIVNNEHLTLTDARWNERLAAFVLMAAILIMGIAPFLVTDIIYPGTEVMMQHIVSNK